MTPASTAFRDRFTIDREIGRDRFGAIYLGRDVEAGRFVTLRVLAAEIGGPLGVEGLNRIMERVAAVDHPGLATPQAWGEGSNGLYVAWPAPVGETARDRLAKHRLFPPKEAVRIATAAGQALAAAHRVGVAHGALTPGTILLQGQGVLVADLGLGMLLAEARAPRPDPAAAGMAYVSPEELHQAAGPSPAGDVYSLGALTFEMVTGQAPAPFPAPSRIPTSLSGRQLPPIPSILKHRPEVPHALDSSVGRAMAFRPEDRFADGARFATVLEESMRPGTEFLPHSDRPSTAMVVESFTFQEAQRKQEKKERARSVEWKIGLLLLLAAAVAAYVVLR